MGHTDPKMVYFGELMGNERREWRPIPGHPGYEASDDGLVRSLDRIDASGKQRKGRVLKQRLANGYPVVNIGGRTVKVHRLVLLAFEGPCPKGMEACHYNGNRQDNRIDNLRWATHRHNLRDFTAKCMVKRHAAEARRQTRTLEFARQVRILRQELGLSEAYITDVLLNEASLNDEQVTRLLMAAAADGRA